MVRLRDESRVPFRLNFDLRDRLLHDARARPLALLLVTVAAAFCLYLLVQWLLLVLRWTDAPPAGAADIGLLTAESTPTDRLARLHLFGASTLPVDQRSLASTAPDSTSQLILRGVFAAADPRAGRAIIAGPDQKESQYAVGATLPGNVQLVGVHADRVVISNGGAIEVLRMPRAGTAGTGGVTPTSTGASGQAAPLPTAGHSAPIPGDLMAGAGSAAPLIAPMTAGSLGAAATGLGVDPTQLAREVRLEPVLADGKQTGVRVVSSNAALLEKLGLQPGDELTSVNGIALDNPLRGAEVMQNLGQAQSATLTVRRDGREQTLSVALR